MSSDRRVREAERAAARGEAGGQARLEREVTRRADREEQGPGGFTVLGPGPGVCQECARDHEPGQAHDKQSLHYQYHFRARNGRWPTWRDAIAHCDPETQRGWEQELRRLDAWDGWSGDTPPEPEELPTGLIGSMEVVQLGEIEVDVFEDEGPS